MSTKTGRVAAVVAAHLEPITRFGAADLSAPAPEQSLEVALLLELEQRVHFAAARHSGAGRLPGHVIDAKNKPALETELERERRSAESGARGAVEAWLQRDPGAYRRLLPAESTFALAPRAHGYQEACGPCQGQGKLTCTSCRGKGRTDCSHCMASGRMSCSACNGSRRVSCGSCSGRGRWSETVNEYRWDESRKENVSVPVYKQMSCGSCGGDGRRQCGHCDWSGKVTCSWCMGQGHNRCTPCNATGKVDCKTCAASGIVHLWAVIEAEVTRRESLHVSSDDAVLADQVRERLERKELPALGALNGVDNQVLADGLSSRFRLRLDVRRAPLVLAGRTFTFYGYGPEAKVVDFGNVAGHLLAGDLQALEHAMAAGGRFRAGSELLAVTQRFVESELNLAIAEQVSDLKATPEAAAERVERLFKGTVDAAYVARAVVALRLAFRRLYGAELLWPLVGLAATAAVASAAWFVTAGPIAEDWQLPVTVAVAGVLLWFVPEWVARRRLKRAFPSEIAKRVLGQLRASRSPWHWRGGALAALGLASFGGWYVSGQVPWVQQLHGARTEARNFDRHLESWQRAPVPDLSLRTYPADEPLRQAAARGDRRAAVALAWKSLTGAGGTPVDPQSAARSLEGWQAATPVLDALARTARAAVVVQRGNASPEELQQAAAALAGLSASVQGVGIEARYWEARILLENGPPLRNTALGLRKLAEAADRGHGRAALLLGERYARGADLKRDPARARRYLTLARSLGVPEAVAALQALR